jgi:hypothetical protein
MPGSLNIRINIGAPYLSPLLESCSFNVDSTIDMAFSDRALVGNSAAKELNIKNTKNVIVVNFFIIKIAFTTLTLV